MAETVRNLRRCVALLLGLLALPGTSSAHRLDEYLQATLVAIEPGHVRLEINLTPGVDVAEKVLALIDHNRDGRISVEEAGAYQELLKHDLVLRVDDREVELQLTSSNFPASRDLRTGWGFIQMEFSAELGPLGAGPHRLTLENRHLPELSVYLFNAARPRSAAVQITKQTRNKTQSKGEIEFVTLSS